MKRYDIQFGYIISFSYICYMEKETEELEKLSIEELNTKILELNTIRNNAYEAYKKINSDSYHDINIIEEIIKKKKTQNFKLSNYVGTYIKEKGDYHYSVYFVKEIDFNNNIILLKVYYSDGDYSDSLELKEVSVDKIINNITKGELVSVVEQNEIDEIKEHYNRLSI